MTHGKDICGDVDTAKNELRRHLKGCFEKEAEATESRAPSGQAEFELLGVPSETIHILRNPYGYSKEEIKAAQLKACDFIEMFQSAYENMRDWAKANGVDTAARNT